MSYNFATERDIRRVIAATRNNERAIQNLKAFVKAGLRPRSELWAAFKNDTGETVPRSAILRVTGIATDSSGGYYLEIAKPSTTFSRQFAVSCRRAIPSGEFGLAFLGYAPIEIQYDTGTPAAGDVYGAKPSQFTVSKNYPGYLVLDVKDTTNKILLAVPEPILTLHGKADAKIANDSTGTFSVYIDKSTDSTINITVRVAEYAPDLFADEWATVHWHNGQWYYDESGKAIDGTLAGALAVGSSATMNVDPGSDTVTVYDAVMKTGTADIASGKKIYAEWFKLRKRWQAVQAECP